MAYIFGDNKAWGVRTLNAALPGVTVTGREPVNPPTPTVWVESDGGRGRRMLEDSFLRINAYAPTRDDAHDLARLVEAHLLPDGNPVTSVERSTGPNDVTPPASTTFQFYSLFAITSRAKELS